MPADADFYTQVESEVKAGLGNEKEALYDAWANLRFAEEEFDEFPTRWPDEDGYDRAEQYRRTSGVMARAVTLLSQNLYKHSPIRRLATTEGTAWLEKVYQASAMGAKWQRADKLATIGDYAAMQFVGTEDPEIPVKVHLWSRDQLVVWVDPEDPTEPAAVATLDLYDGRRRLTLWTPDEVIYYTTEKGDSNAGTGTSAYKEVSRKDNPYRESELPGPDGDDDGNGEDKSQPRGILPFAFVHFEFPAQKFDTPGPGTSFRRLNDAVNARLDWLGEAVRYLSKPIGVAEGVSATWKPPARIKPGTWITLQGDEVDLTGTGPVPRLYYVNPDTGFIVADWTDLNNYIDHEMQMHGLPPAVFRMVQTGTASGVALMCEQAPLLSWVEGRQEPFTHYERKAAMTCLKVAASHLRTHGNAARAASLDQLVKAGVFSLRWGPLYMLLPGPERDQADQWRIDLGIADQVTVLMERERLSEEEALEYLTRLSERKVKLDALGIVAKQLPAPGQAAVDEDGNPVAPDDPAAIPGKPPIPDAKKKGGDDAS